MNRFTLKFVNQDMESEYSKHKYSAIMENIKLLLFFPILVELYVGIPAILDGHLLGFLVTLGVIGLFVVVACFGNRLERYRRFLIFLPIITLYFARPFFIPNDFEDNSKGVLLMRGYSIASIQIPLMTRFPGLTQKTNAVLIGFIVRFAIMGYLDQDIFHPILFMQYFLIDCFIVYVFYSNEKTEREIFLKSWESRENFRKFKELVDNYLPQSIVIFNKKNCLFSNKAASDVFQRALALAGQSNDILLSVSRQEELATEIGSLQIEKSTVNVMGHPQSLPGFTRETIFLSDMIHKFAKNPLTDNKALSFSAFRTLEEEKQTFGVILTKIKWDEESAVAIVLNDTTEHENLLALKIADENKDKTLATVSHELRTPLNGIIGILDMAEAKVSDKEVVDYLELCKDNAQLLLGLVNSILDIHQIRQGKLKLNVTKVNITKVLKDIMRLFHFQCSQKGIFLKLDIDKDTPSYIATDENRLKQIFINLVGNAIKFTSRGGITIGVTPEPGDTDLNIWVLDTGIGIKDDDKGKLFKMYGKLKDGESVNKNGVGLGLTISNALAQLLSGRTDNEGIHLQSIFGEGTKFQFSIARNINRQIDCQTNKQENLIVKFDLQSKSLSEDDVSEYPEGYNFQPKITHSNSNHMLLKGQTPRESFSIRKYSALDKTERDFEYHLRKIKLGHILVVDDNPFNLMVARNAIDRLGYECETASDGSEAINKVRVNATTLDIYKVILMDQHMPILDGIAATRILRDMMQKGDVPTIPIIALTANNDEKSIKECYECGMSNHLPKPLRADELSNLLTKLNTTTSYR